MLERHGMRGHRRVVIGVHARLGLLLLLLVVVDGLRVGMLVVQRRVEGEIAAHDGLAAAGDGRGDPENWACCSCWLDIMVNGVSS